MGAEHGRRRRDGIAFEGRTLGMIVAPGVGDANTVPNPSLRGTHDKCPPGAARVTCWCERRVVIVALDDIVSGRTGTCGRADCHA